MRKVLLTTMFGALFATSSLSAKAQAGSVSGNVGVSAGVVFFSGVKTKGQTAVGGVKVTEAVVRDGNADVAAGNTILKSKADITSKTTDIKKKAGAIVELTAGGSYWFTDNLAAGLDLGFGVTNGKFEDEKTGNRSKVSTTFSIMPTMTFYMTDNLVLNVGLGVAWTKVKDLGIALADDAKKADASSDITAAAVADAAAAAALFNTPAMNDKFVTDYKHLAGAANAAPDAQVQLIVPALNAHNASVVSAAQKSFKTKPCFTAKVSVGYVLGENSQISLGYKYTGIKSKAKNATANQLKANMHSIVATYSYHF